MATRSVRLANTHLRKQSGNMLLLTFAVIGIIVLLVIAGLSFNYFQFGFEKAEQQSDRLALTEAAALNSADRIGQMNNTVARARELVFNLRSAMHQTSSGHANLAPLAKGLLSRARENAYLVENTRHALIETCVNEVKENAKKSGEQESSSGGFGTFLFKAQAPKISTVTVGYLDKVDSNVKQPEGNDPLLLYDLNRGYVRANTKLYAANVNIVLPGEDSDLPFYLSSIPAPIKGTIAQARLLKEKNFRTLATIVKDGKPTDEHVDQLPSALKLDMSMAVQTGDTKKGKSTANMESIAATVGAAPAP